MNDQNSSNNPSTNATFRSRFPGNHSKSRNYNSKRFKKKHNDIKPLTNQISVNNNDMDDIKYSNSDHKYNNLNNINLNQLNDYNIQQRYGEEDIIEDDLQSICSVKTTVYQNNKYNQYYHRYNKYNNKYKTNKGYQSYNNNNNNNRIMINTKYANYPWRKYPNSCDLIKKMSEIEKYGVLHLYLRNSKFKRYGLKLLEKDFKGNYIALYEGNIDDFISWVYAYLGLNFKHHLSVFSRSDLFGDSVICGIDLSKDQQRGMRIVSKLCKYGWIDGLKHVIETLKINPIIKNNDFSLLVDTVYRFHDDILKYLLIQNNYYVPFNILTKRNKYNETLWISAKKHLKDIIEPGKGWLHCLESIHYAPIIINAMNVNNNDEKKQQYNDDDDDEGFQLQTNVMLQELNGINLICNTIILSPFIVQKRLEIINKLVNNSGAVIFKIESCYYGLCADTSRSRSFDKIHFWKPHAVKRKYDRHIFEYIPYNNTEYGLIRMHNLSLNHYLTAINKDNLKKVELCKLIQSNNNINDIQLWKIEQVDIFNGIWIRILNKAGYKLIISWKQDKQCGYAPLLTISNNIINDSLCRDVFSVPSHNRDTLYSQYYNKYKHITKNNILNSIAVMLCKYRFWNQSNINGKSKFDIFKKKVKNIAEIIQQYNQRYIQNISKPTRRRPSPPPPPPPID